MQITHIDAIACRPVHDMEIDGRGHPEVRVFVGFRPVRGTGRVGGRRRLFLCEESFGAEVDLATPNESYVV